MGDPMRRLTRTLCSLAFCSLVTSHAAYSQSIWARQGGAIQPFGDIFSAALSTDGNTMALGVWPGVGLVYTRQAGIWTRQAQLDPSGVVGQAEFGHSVAISGDGNTIVFGAPFDNSLRGGVWTYVRNGTTWTELPKLIATDAPCVAEQGYAVAISQDGATMLVGAQDTGGCARVYARAGGFWTYTQKLTAPSTLGLGFSVSLSADGKVAVVGDPATDVPPGAAYVFTRSGTAWSGGVKLFGSGGAGQLSTQGFSVAVSGDGATILVGGRLDNSEAGAAWVWVRTGSGWVQQGNKLAPSDIVGKALFGEHVALSTDGNSAFISGAQDSKPGTNARGAVWAFSRTNGVWTETQKIFDTTGVLDFAGRSLAVSPNSRAMIVGGLNAAGLSPIAYPYVYGLPSNTSISSIPSSMVFGDAALVQARVTPTAGGNPTGSVTFQAAVDLGNAPVLNGVASLSLASLSAGLQYISAYYSGDDNFISSTSTVALVNVQKAVAAVSAPVLTAGSSVFGQPLTLRAVVSGKAVAPGGVVTFNDGSTTLGLVSTDNTGTATLSLPGLPAGSHAITAVYGGDGNYLPSAASAVLALTVAPAAAPAKIDSPTAAAYGESVAFTATFTGVTAAPVGGNGTTAAFVDTASGGSVLCAAAPVTNGQATCTPLGPLALGPHTVSISALRGDARYSLGQVTPVTVTIKPAATTTVVSGPAGLSQGAAIVKAKTSVLAPGAAPLGGRISFSSNGAEIPECRNLPVNARGEAACAITGGPGQYLIGGSYSGDAFTLGSADAATTAVVSNPNPILALNGASYAEGAAASDEIVALFGANLAAASAAADSLPWPTTLAGISVQVTDSAGIARLASLVYASPTQINCILPAGMAPGGASLSIVGSPGAARTAAFNIVPSAAGLFSANASGQGVAAANVQTVHAGGASTIANAAVFDPARGAFTPAAIDLGVSGDQVYLILYGTGLRGVSSADAASATIQEQRVPILFIGATPGYPGLDQVNLGPLPIGLKGAGAAAVRLIVEGRDVNAVTLAFQ
jgi:uncharacterized protein (TIGR03437 family)